ncbi:MAG: SH3 domain-containing protein [Enterocloster sp.]
MSNVERTTSWQLIQQGVKEAERLIARKEYNLVMVKARQTLECMVRCLAERACLVEGDLSDTIDQLYEGKWIDKPTRDNYHTIRILGNKAVHEGDNTAYNANQAYQLLTQEVYVFANEFTGSKPGRSSSGTRTAARSTGNRQSGAARSSSGARSGQTGSRGSSSRSSYSSRQGTARRKKRRVSPAAYLWRLLIPLLAVILLIVVIRMILPGKDKKADSSVPAVTQSAEAPEPVPVTEPEPSTEAEPEPSVERYRVRGNSVNVRSEPSTDCRILAQLSGGTEVEYVKRYNNDWSVINYDGQEAYISSQYLEKIEEPAAPEETEAPAQ